MLNTQARPVGEKPSADWMCGSATLTMVASRPTIIWAATITARTSPGRCVGWACDPGPSASPDGGGVEAGCGAGAVASARDGDDADMGSPSRDGRLRNGSVHYEEKVHP